jgi:hypothetical protein
MRSLFKVIIVLIIISGCTAYEMVMPFRNYVTSGESIFPLKNNDSEIAFRAWINYGTSVDRVITVSKDSLFGNQCQIVEIGKLDKKRLFRTKSREFYYQRETTPTSGYASFFNMIDSLSLIKLTSQDSFAFAMHTPFSHYVIEIKQNDSYNLFKFNTHFPDTSWQVENKYQVIENLIFNEFDFHFYMKN